MNNLIIRLLLVMCGLGITVTSISIGKIYVFEKSIQSFTPLQLNVEEEQRLNVLKAKIKSDEVVSLSKEMLYLRILNMVWFTLITACILFHLLLIVFIYSNRRKSIPRNTG